MKGKLYFLFTCLNYLNMILLNIDISYSLAIDISYFFVYHCFVLAEANLELIKSKYFALMAIYIYIYILI